MLSNNNYEYVLLLSLSPLFLQSSKFSFIWLFTYDWCWHSDELLLCLNIILWCFMIRHTIFKKWILIFPSKDTVVFGEEKQNQVTELFLIISLPIYIFIILHEICPRFCIKTSNIKALKILCEYLMLLLNNYLIFDN